MKKAITALSIVALILFNFNSINAQKNWNKSHTKSQLVYTPKDLKAGELFSVTFPNPQKLNGTTLKEWTLSTAKKMHSQLGPSLDAWKIKPEKNGAWGISNSYKNKQGKKVRVGYQGGTFANGDAYILQMKMLTDLSKMIKYGMQTNTLVKDAEKSFAGKSTTVIASNSSSKTRTTSKKATAKNSNQKEKTNTKLTGRQRRLALERTIRTTPGKGVPSNKIEALWVDRGVDVLRGGIDLNTYLLLKDGTVYTECEIPPNELDVSKSKKLQVAGPIYRRNKWTVWRKSGSGYEIKSIKKGTWEKLEGRRAVKASGRLNNKYISAGGSRMSGSWKYFITFKPNGRFEMSSSTFKDNSSLGGGNTGAYVASVKKSDKTGTRGSTVVSGNNVGGGASSKINDGDKNKGSYQINGYTITLKHDNGYEHTELFFYAKPSKESFVYADKLYWIPKK